MRVHKAFTFHAAHRLLGHRGLCGWLHGHTYRLDVVVEGDRLDALGMLIDFDDLAALVHAAVLDRWDHSTILHRDDPLVPALASVESEAPERLVLLGENPSAEVLAREAYGAIAKRLPEGVRLATVTVWETATSSSEYHGEPCASA